MSIREILKKVGVKWGEDVELPAELQSLEKSLVIFRNESYYAAAEGKNVLDLGWELPADVSQGDHDLVGRYALLIHRGWSNIELQLFDEGVETSEVHSQALELTENNKNNVTSVMVGKGVPQSFAGRPIFLFNSRYAHISKSELEKLKEEGKDVSLCEAEAEVEAEDSASSDATEHGDAAIKEIAESLGLKPAGGNPEEGIMEKVVKIKKAFMDKGLVYGVVYEPMVKDSHGDWTTPEEIEQACHEFLPLAKGAEWTDKDHETDIGAGVDVVECYIAPCDFEIGDEPVKKGSWVLVAKVTNEDLKKEIENGETTGFSMAGTCLKV
jgi:hypothetical protein